jgi:hypothetical protein
MVIGINLIFNNYPTKNNKHGKNILTGKANNSLYYLLYVI